MAEPAAVPPVRAPAAAQLRDLFLLDPSACYLDHRLPEALDTLVQASSAEPSCERRPS